MKEGIHKGENRGVPARPIHPTLSVEGIYKPVRSLHFAGLACPARSLRTALLGPAKRKRERGKARSDDEIPQINARSPRLVQNIVDNPLPVVVELIVLSLECIQRPIGKRVNQMASLWQILKFVAMFLQFLHDIDPKAKPPKE